jgi:hypothetical protein
MPQEGMSMKRFLWLAVFLSLVSIATSAAGVATMGVYFEGAPGEMTYSPKIYEHFKMYVYLHSADALVTGVEFRIASGFEQKYDSGPTPFAILGYSLPQGALEMGSLWDGFSIVFWPPLDGFAGYNLITELTCLGLTACGDDGGPLWNYWIRIGAHNETDLLRGTFYPDNDFFPIIGLTSLLCPGGCYGLGCVGTETTSWGSIKSLFK